jgi:hypothetical protein
MAADSGVMATHTNAPFQAPLVVETASAERPVDAEKDSPSSADVVTVGDTPKQITTDAPSPTTVDDREAVAVAATEERVVPTELAVDDEDDEDDEFHEALVDDLNDEEEKASVVEDEHMPASTTSVVLETSVPPTPPTELPPLAAPVPARAVASARGDGPDSSSTDARPASVTARPQSTSSMSAATARSDASGGGPGANRNHWNMQTYLRSNAKINRLVQAALLKTLIHAIRRGSVEGVRVAIERGVLVQYLDNRQRNLIMYSGGGDLITRVFPLMRFGLVGSRASVTRTRGCRSS